MEPFDVSSGGATLVGERSGSGPPVLLLHGGPGLSDYLESLARELDGTCTTFRYTQRGVAPSSVAGPFRVEDHVADALAVLDGLALERAWIVGHSWGGHLAMHVAVAAPERTAGLVCIDSLGATGDGGYAPFAATLGERYERSRGKPLPEDAELEEYWHCYFADPACAPPMPPMEANPAVYAETFASITEHFEQGTLERGLPSFGGPALFVHGRESPLSVSAAEESAALIPGAEVEVLDDCGHFPWLERPGSVAEPLARVL